MDIKGLIGWKMENALEWLEQNELNFRVIELFDTKGTKLGNERRVVNIRETELVELYVAYF